MSFKLTILGSSSALPTSERFPSAHVLTVHERPFLIDCGEGTQMQIRRNKIKMSRINHIFISHLHGDHIFGLYGLLSSLNLMGREHPLNIYAPAGYEHILPSHLSDFDIVLNYDLGFTPLASNDALKIVDDKHVTVTAFPLKHRVPAYGFLFREKERERNIISEAIELYSIPVSAIKGIKRGADFVTAEGNVIPNGQITTDAPKPLSYAYCTDTAYYKRVASFVRGVDLLYHEATFDESLRKMAVMTGHSTAADAAKIALEAGAGQLIIGHFSSRYKDLDLLIDEARAVFPETIAAVEGMTVDMAALRKS